MNSLRILPPALDELDQAERYYEEAKPGLGREFHEEVESAFNAIKDHPERARTVTDHTQKYLLDRFPYAILFVVEPEETVIVAIMHCARQPGYWTDRV